MTSALKFFALSFVSVLIALLAYLYISIPEPKPSRFDINIDSSNSLLIGQNGKSDFHVVCLSREPRLFLRTRYPEEHDHGTVPVSGTYDTALYINAHSRGRLMGGAIDYATIDGHKAKVYFDHESYYHRDLIIADASGSDIRRVLSNITKTGYWWIDRNQQAVELSGRIDGRQINPFIERCQAHG